MNEVAVSTQPREGGHFQVQKSIQVPNVDPVPTEPQDANTALCYQMSAPVTAES